MINLCTKFCLLVLLLMASFKMFSQSAALSFFSDPRPTELITPGALKANNIRAETIYRYKNINKRKDSSLVEVNFFDSLGLRLKTEEFGDGDTLPRQITTYTYTYGLLTKQEIIAALSIDHKIITFDYDSAGNKTDEKIYSHSAKNQDAKLSFDSENQWQYDSLSRITKVYDRGGKGQLYLHYAYYYDGDRLKKIAAFDYTGLDIYSSIFEYNDSLNSRSEFLVNSDTNLTEKIFYNDKKEIIKSIYYDHPYIVYNNTTRYFEYSDDLLVTEKEKLRNGVNVYFKHYYFKNTW